MPAAGCARGLARDELAPVTAAAADTARDPWLSILVPVYNVAEWVRPCVQSILDQALDGVEVILLDDASTDESRAVCDVLCAEHAPRLRLLGHERNRGLSAARNTMLEAARGTYVWFVDGDDEMLPGAVARLHEVVTQHAPDVVLCDFSKLGRHEAGFRGRPGLLERDRDALLRGLFASRRMHVWTKITRRALWDGAPRFPEGRCYEDMATMPWLFLRAGSFFYVPNPWIAYRVRPGSITQVAAHTSGHFDEGKNDDVARALDGFAAGARAALPELSAATVDAISRFCAKEFTKIGWRLIKHRFGRDDWGHIIGRMCRYRRMLESASPRPFAAVTASHLRHGRLAEFLRLAAFRFLTRRAGSTTG